MPTMSHREYYQMKHANRSLPFLVNRKLMIHKQLEKAARTYAVYTDLHGSYEKFIQWVKNGMGYYRIAISEILGNDYGEEITALYERLLLIVNRHRVGEIEKYVRGENPHFSHQNYFFEPVPMKFNHTLELLEAHHLTPKRVLKDLLHLLRMITRGDEHLIFKAIPDSFQENVLKLYFKKDTRSYESLLEGIAGNRKLYSIFASYMVKLIIVNMLEKHVNLGDSFDRGDGADRLIRFFRGYFDAEVNSPPLHYIWGNHDILWMGASIGNPILCATALRISMRYNNLEFLDRYGFNLEGLRDFARKTYKLPPTGAYTKIKKDGVWSQDDATKMTKTLLILEVKLTLQHLRKAIKIQGEIDYADEERRFTRLLELIPTGVEETPESFEAAMQKHPLYSDVYFPTVNPDAPEELTPEEQTLMDDIVRQFTTLPKFQDDIRWMFWKGEMYRVVDNALYYHAALPATENMELSEIKGMRGKALLDWIQRDLKRIKDKWMNDEDPTLREKMLLWYLWTGEESPFFCKSKMATLERAIFNKEEADKDPLTTWREEKNLYYKFIRDDRFLNQILNEFHAERLVMGHTPVANPEQSMLSQDIRAFIIDGGASSAYGDKGAVLIKTPEYTYLTFHPSLDDLMQAEDEDRLPSVQVQPLEERSVDRLVDMEKGYFLQEELAAIDELLSAKLDLAYRNYFF